MKEIIKAYKYILRLVLKNIPFTFGAVIILSITAGFMNSYLYQINSSIIDRGVLVASGKEKFGHFIVLLSLFAVFTILPQIINIYIYNYAEKKVLLMVKTNLREGMLQEFGNIKYEHSERKSSIQIIDRAFNNVEQSCRHLYPMYFCIFFSSAVSIITACIIILHIKWWLLLTLVLPFLLQMYILKGKNKNIYKEFDKFWAQDKVISTLNSYGVSKEHVKEIQINKAAEFLIKRYDSKIDSRNKEYEGLFFKYLKSTLLSSNITEIASFLNILIVMVLFFNHEISIGALISASLLIANSFYTYLKGPADIILYSGMHAIEFGYLNKYFDLAEKPKMQTQQKPENFCIEFRDVWFRYPETEDYILKGLSFLIKNGEKISIVGENGEGKSTIIKLLLGLFDSYEGEILVGGKDLREMDSKSRFSLFGIVFQDFGRYSISLEENIAIGDVKNLEHQDEIEAAAKKAGLDKLTGKLNQGFETILGKEFKNSQDLSGGEWQRVAIARALMGNKPIMIFDEPTSALDPMAESELYHVFSRLSENKTLVLVTHRLSSTMITDKILVLKNGKIQENGTHEQLIKDGGIYSIMFRSQKNLYNGEIA